MKTKTKIIKGNIIDLKIGAIVNAANKKLLGGEGVDGAIHRAAGPGLMEECEKLGGCRTGEAKITRGYNLPAKYVIHTVGPIYGQENGKEAKLLADCYKNCLKIAKENNVRSVAFPAISTGAYGYPKQKAAITAVESVNEFVKNNDGFFDEIIFTCFDDESYQIYKNIL